MQSFEENQISKKQVKYFQSDYLLKEFGQEFGVQQFLKFLLTKFKNDGKMINQLSTLILNQENLKKEITQKYLELLLENLDLKDPINKIKLNNIFFGDNTLQKNLSGQFIEKILKQNHLSKFFL